ncbi:MAG: hypothetical protein KJ070_02205 [Verrucomicrobia bacterium]|nr:hypothetical protein [Verrucomicrobiota bacterium]
MVLIDFILNLAGLLLWFNWRASGYDPLARSRPATLAGTVRRIETPQASRWLSLAALTGLLIGRAVLYRLAGPSVDWTPHLDLGAITLFFRTDALEWVLLFSVFSFLRVLAVVYFWLLALSIVNRKVSKPDLILRFIRFQLGRVRNWPLGVQLGLPLLLAALVWPGLHALLTWANITGALPSAGSLVLQGVVLGLGIFLSLKYLIPIMLLADVVTRYVYFGTSPIWDFLNTTARNLLSPLGRLPLRAGKLELTPLLGIALSVVLLHALPRLVLQELHRRNLTLWPH